jgi:hypothetical protein
MRCLPCSMVLLHASLQPSPTSGGRSVGIVRSWTQTMEFFHFSQPDLILSELNTFVCRSPNCVVPTKFSEKGVINQAKGRSDGNHQKWRSEMKWSEVKWSEVKWNEIERGKSWREYESYISVVKWIERKVMVKHECNRLWNYAFHYFYCLVYSMLKYFN